MSGQNSPDFAKLTYLNKSALFCTEEINIRLLKYLILTESKETKGGERWNTLSPEFLKEFDLFKFTQFPFWLSVEYFFFAPRLRKVYNSFSMYKTFHFMFFYL